MTDFDNFLKKKNDEIRDQREAKRLKDAKAHEDFLALKSLTNIEWPKIIPAIRAETDGRVIDDKSFLPTSDSSIALGSIFLVLLNHGQGDQSYSAVYKTPSPNGGYNELAKINLTPTLSIKDLVWTAHGLGFSGPLTTTDLARALAMKLVGIYQENQP